jgi:hypothetical protein
VSDSVKKQPERRSKTRFPIQRELRYKLLVKDTVVESGVGETIDIASGGIAFQLDHPLRTGALIELSISWPMMLHDNCPMRLVVYGRVVHSAGRRSACRVDKYEFRTQARATQSTLGTRGDQALRRWAGATREKAATMVGI